MVQSNKAMIAKSIENLNTTYQVVIYSKSYCPYCRATKQLFNSMPSVQVKTVELDQEVDGMSMQQVLFAKTGQRTVPNVFVNNQHIGGNSDVQQAHNDGTLKRMLELCSFKDQPTKTDNLQEKLRELIHKENSEHTVVIWSKSYCPHCRATKKLFAGETDVDVAIHEMNEMENGDLLHKELELLTGQRTVPNVFINGKHIGGNSDVQELAGNGKLRKLLK